MSLFIQSWSKLVWDMSWKHDINGKNEKRSILHTLHLSFTFGYAMKRESLVFVELLDSVLIQLSYELIFKGSGMLLRYCSSRYVALVLDLNIFSKQFIGCQCLLLYQSKLSTTGSIR